MAFLPRMNFMRVAVVSAVLLAPYVATVLPLRAQEAAPKPAPEAPAPTAKPAASPAPADAKPAARPSPTPSVRLLPADSITDQVLELPGRTLKFKATAGSIALTGTDGQITAELAYISYQRDGADPLTRPVAFVFNGGPGSSSAWTHLIGFGPWRLPVDATTLSPSGSAVLVPNAETWLDFTDLVFIDPAGTGYSQIAKAATPATGGAAPSGDGSSGQGGARYFYSVDGDADSVAQMISQWLQKQNRLTSPKFLVGESYGGIRAPKVLYQLQTTYGVGMSGLVLVSPVMDMGQYRGARHRPSEFMNSLPTIAAAAREAKGKEFSTRADQSEVEAYTRGEYLADLMRGPRDTAAMDRIVKRVAIYAGLPEPVVRQYGGRLDEFIYIREANRLTQRQASGYDTTITGADANPNAYFPRWNDPLSEAMSAPMTSAVLGLYAKLGWKTELPYRLIAGAALRSWQWGNSNSGTESVSQLEAALALDPKLRVLVTHGATDLRTPYFGSVLLLEQLPAYADTPPGRTQLRLYPGGHMHYSRDSSRAALRGDVEALVQAVVGK